MREFSSEQDSFRHVLTHVLAACKARALKVAMIRRVTVYLAVAGLLSNLCGVCVNLMTMLAKENRCIDVDLAYFCDMAGVDMSATLLAFHVGGQSCKTERASSLVQQRRPQNCFRDCSENYQRSAGGVDGNEHFLLVLSACASIAWSVDGMFTD